MSNVELILNMLAEASTTEISQNEKPEAFDESKNAKDLQGLPQPPDKNDGEE